MNTPVRILSVSDDDGLRLSREMLLANDGYKMESTTSNTTLSVACVRSFDIALICHSVEPERAMTLAEMLRRYNPDIRILTISQLEDRQMPFDADLEIPSGPEQVLEACRKVCSEISARSGDCEPSHQG